MSDPALKRRRRRLRFGLRTMFAVVAILAIVSTYLGSYYRISRRCLAEQGDIFWYAIPEAPNYDESRHHRLRRFYSPANYFDRMIFNGPEPAMGGTFDLE